MRCEEAQELITGLVDGELSPQESLLIKAHFGDCRQCPRIYSLEWSLKRALRDAAMNIHAPAALKEKLLRDQGRSLSRTRFSGFLGSLPRFSTFSAQAAVITALFFIPILSARYWLHSPYVPIVPGIFQNYRQITHGEIVPSEMASLPKLKERLMQSVDGKFAPMAYDFSTMELHLMGGMVQEIAKRKVLVAVYKGSGATVICYTFLGSEADALAVAEMIFDPEKRMNFFQFFHAGTNAVMHREGNVMCILMSQMAADELLVLARAKAHAT
ncbi:MAG: zf-HC2 domain-containing protein [Candidatus Binatia bacterium]